MSLRDLERVARDRPWHVHLRCPRVICVQLARRAALEDPVLGVMDTVTLAGLACAAHNQLIDPAGTDSRPGEENRPDERP